ncbi:unnamed protein product [Dicrocoelium dendriticum]|nr:unnamed protein product [Dicrocoelium dendriticum]
MNSQPNDFGAWNLNDRAYPECGNHDNPEGGPTYPQPGYYGSPQMGPCASQQGFGFPCTPITQPAFGSPQSPVQPNYQLYVCPLGFPPQQQPCFNPTLRPYPHFNAEEDCEKLRKAMKGIGTDENAIIDVLAHRTADQRVQLVKQFKIMYGKDLISELKSELTGHFEDVVEAMCYTLEELDARALREAMKGAGTNEGTLIEILATRSNEQIKKIKELYSSIFGGRDLEKDLTSETHGYFKRVLVSMVQGGRDESHHVDHSAVEHDAEELYNAGEKALGTDESTFITILLWKSEAHVRAVIDAYEKHSNKDFEDVLKSELSGDLLRSFLAVVRSIRNKPRYFAHELRKSMEGAGTDDKKLIRIVVSRAEVDMGDIKREFMKQYGKPLATWITDDTTGDYKRMLLALVGD